MKKLLTFLTLLTLFFGVGWAETQTITVDFESGSLPSGWTNSNFEVLSNPISGTSSTNGSYCASTGGKANSTLTYNTKLTGVSSISVDAARTTNNTNSNLYIQYSTDNSTWIDAQQVTINKNAWTTTTYTFTSATDCYVRICWNGTTAVKLIDNIVITYGESGGQQDPDPTTPSGTITFTPAAGEVTSGTTVAMSFSGTCTGIKYTLDGTSPSATNGTVYDASNPPSITGATTIKAAAYNYSNSKYAFGTEATAEYTVVIPTVEYDGTATFVSGTDVGTSSAQNNEDQIIKYPVTFHSTNAALATETYRLYSGSTTTFSVPDGYKIVKIEFTGTETSRALTNLSTTVGTYTATTLSGTWIGNAQSVAFTASAQTRASEITVYYTSPATVEPVEIKRIIKTNGDATNEAGGWFGNWSENCETPDGVSGNHYKVTALPGETIQFKAGSNNGYQILEENVSAVDANGTTVTLTKVSSDNSGIVFSFTMPASEVTITANFTYYRPTLRMAGRFNGGTVSGENSRWVEDNSGPAFTYDATNDKYTQNVYFIGASNDNGTMVDYFYFRSDNSDLKAKADGNYWVTTLGSELSNVLGGGANFRIEPGVYTITISGDLSTIKFDKITPTITFSPAADDDVYVGQSVTATSTLTDIIAAIKATDSGAAGEVSVQVSGDNTTFADSYPFSTVGSQTVYGKATIGNITVTGEASYNVQEAAGGDQYVLVTDASQLVSGNDYVIVTSKAMTDNFYALGTSVSNGTAAQSTDFVLAGNTVTVTGTTVNVLTLSGNSSDGWNIKTSNGNYLTGSSGNLAATATSIPTNTWSVSIDNNNIATITYGATTTRSIIYRTSAEGFKNYATSNANSDGYSTVKLYMKQTATPTVADPVFDPAAGTYTEAQNVTITCNTEGATIYYTTDGTIPSAENGTEYSAAIPVSETTTIKAIAVKEGYRSSSVVTAKYTIEIPVDPGEGEFTLVTSADQLIPGYQYILVWRDGPLTMSNADNTNNFLSTEIQLSTDELTATADENTEILTLEGEEGAWMFYVPETEGYLACATGNNNRLLRNGSADSDASKATIAITEAGRATIQFNAGTRNIIFYNHSNNADIWACYTSKQTDYEYPALYYRPNGIAKPTFDPEEGIYNIDVTASISCATSGATIYYTTNGDEPTTSSTVYTGEFIVSETTTVKAIAVKGGETSPVASVTYTITPNTAIETVTPDYIEPLISGIGKFTVENVSGFAPVWTLDGHYGIKGTAYDGENHIATSWFLSPIIDLSSTSAPELKFDHQINTYFSNVTEQATLWVREYTNGVAGEWSQMTVNFSTPDPARGWTDDHAIYDLTDYIDKQVQFGFKYVNNSTESGAGTWEIQNFSVTDNSDIIIVNNIAEFMDMEKVPKGEVAKFRNPVVVLYHYQQYYNSSEEDYENDYIWVKDETGYAIIYGHLLDVEYENGDVIPAGFTATKNYYSVGQFYQMYEPEGLLPATEKALADPEPVTLAKLLANKDGYNGHYVTISKMQIQYNQGELEAYTSSSSGQRRFSVGDATVAIADNQASTTASGNNGKIIGYNNFDNPWLETLNYPEYQNNSTVYGDYNITGIFEQYNGTWEFMPINITEWEETKLTLHDLCLEGKTGEGENKYTISNNLLGVYSYYDENLDADILWVKDDNGQSIHMVSPKAPYTDNFAIEFEDLLDNNDNVVIPANTRLEQQYYDQSNWCQLILTKKNGSSFVNKIINGGAIKGNFVDKTNPTMENVSLNPETDIYSTSTYAPNYYIPASFVGSQSCATDMYGEEGHGDFFFMTPKPQEYATVVWAVWDGQKMNMPTKQQGNSHELSGEFLIDLSMNQFGTSALPAGVYSFHAIIRKVNTNGAPALKGQGGIQNDQSANYMVYPLDIDPDNNPSTAINTVDVNGKTVKSVKYVNVAGIVSDVPFQGVNIVVTEYTDGSRTTTKMLKK